MLIIEKEPDNHLDAQRVEDHTHDRIVLPRPWDQPRCFSITACLLTLLAASLGYAATPEEKGYEIAKEAERRDEGWDNFKADLTMILKNKQGDQSSRQIRSKNLEVKADGDKSLLIFDSPPDVKGTLFLTHTHNNEDDDQWLYLPALKRVKRISAANKGGSFMGSEFSYEDMSAPEIEKYTYRFLREEDYRGRPSFVLERYPKDERSLYSKHIMWIDQEHYIPWKIQYHNRRNTHLKTLVFRNYKRFLSTFWRPGEMKMDNHRSKKSTILAWKNYQFRVNIAERDFNPRSLARSKY